MNRSLAKTKLLTALVHASSTVGNLRREVAAQNEPWVAEAVTTLDNVVADLDARTVAIEAEF